MKKIKKSAFLSKVILPVTVSATFAALFTSCEYGLNEFLYRKNTVDQRANTIYEIPADEKPVIPESGSYTVVLISDVHFGAEKPTKPRKDDKFFAEIDNMSNKPAFALCLGDIAEHGYESEMESFIKEIVEPLKDKYGIPTYTVVGNHDLYNSGWYSFKKHIYPKTSFYHFTTKNFSWYFLDTASDTLGNHQYFAMEKAMREDPNPKLVFSHIPFYSGDRFYFKMQNSAERNKVISTFARNNVKGIFSGHTHIEDISVLGPLTEYTAGGYFATGAWMILTINEEDASCAVEFKRLEN